MSSVVLEEITESLSYFLTKNAEKNQNESLRILDRKSTNLANSTLFVIEKNAVPLHRFQEMIKIQKSIFLILNKSVEELLHDFLETPFFKF